MGVLKGFGMATGVVVALVAIVGKMRPELFLHLPGMGFVPFMLFGGNDGILPPYFDNSPFKNGAYNQWLKDGDIVIATAAKAGTTWINFCMDAIRRKGSDDIGYSYTDTQYTTPWMECPHKPGETWAERWEGYNNHTLPDGTKLKDYWDHPKFPFRVFKSHYFPIGSGVPPHDVLPVKERPKVKFVIAFRNPIEVAKSVHAFFPKHTPEFQKMWGGFPPHFPNPEAAMKAMLPGGEIDAFFFSYVRAWWPYINEPNVLALHYSEMVKDLPVLVDKLADFAEIKLNGEQKAKVIKKCGFEHMKAHPEFFTYKLPLNGNPMSIMKSGGMVNKGKSEKHTGGEESGFSKEGMQLLQDAIDKELIDPKMKKWVLHGGDIRER